MEKKRKKNADCYWKHGTARAEQFLCFDGKSFVCPKCCVEHCPVETPDFFGECTASGHVIWPGVSKSAQGHVPRKLVCLESAWNDEVFGGLSVKGFLEALKPLIHPPLQVDHRFIESAKHLAYYAKRPDGVLWTDRRAWDVPVFYLAFHGHPGGIDSVLEEIGSKILVDAFSDYGGYPNLIYLGSCSVLKGEAGMKLAKRLLDASGARAILGYTKNVDWMNSLVVDLLFLYRFYTAQNPWKNLVKIYESVKADFHPASQMGYKLLRPREKGRGPHR